VLGTLGFKYLGDLDGIDFRFILSTKNCGRKSIYELDYFLKQIQSEENIQTNIIHIPKDSIQIQISSFPISIRLANVLRNNKYFVLGDLDNQSYDNLQKIRNCGRKTINELKSLISEINSGKEEHTNSTLIKPITPTINFKKIYIPENLHGIALSEIPFSIEIENYFKNCGFKLLGDIHEKSYEILDNFSGRKISEFIAFINLCRKSEITILSYIKEVLILSFLINYIDNFLSELSLRDKTIFMKRYGGYADRQMTLEQIGIEIGVTRERIRQLSDRILRKLSYSLRHYCSELIKHMEKTLNNHICPLTFDLLSYFVKKGNIKHAYPLFFYLTLFEETIREISTWPGGQRPGKISEKSRIILSELAGLIASGRSEISFSEAFNKLKRYLPTFYFNEVEFLSAIKSSKFFTAENKLFDDEPPWSFSLRPKRVNLVDIALNIFKIIDYPITPNQLYDIAKKEYEDTKIISSRRSFQNVLRPENGIYLLGKNIYGQKKNFKLPLIMWRQACSDFADLLEKENRPISTTEIIQEKRFGWTMNTNNYELAAILRQDNRFSDLGRFVFALSVWGIEEREHIHDIIPKILGKTGHPLSASEIFSKLRSFRSASPNSLSSILRSQNNIVNFGFGYYGLNSWGDKAKEYVIKHSMIINRIIKRAEAPFTMNDLCVILNISNAGRLFEIVWKTVKSLENVRVVEKPYCADSILSHKSWTYTRSIYSILERENRPMLIDEILWELFNSYGYAFKKKTILIIKKWVSNSRKFIRNIKNEYFINKNIENYVANLLDIQIKCFEILLEGNEIVGCTELLDRLESDGIDIHEITPTMLSAILRDDERFEEIGKNRFRIKK